MCSPTATRRPCSPAARCPARRWFPEVSLNYAEHVFRDRDDAEIAVRHRAEGGELGEISWGDLRAPSRRLRRRIARARRRARRPRRRLRPELPGRPDRLSRLGVDRRHLVVVLARLRRLDGRRPFRADRAQGAARRRWLHLQRARVRPPRHRRRARALAAEPRAHGPDPVPRPRRRPRPARPRDPLARRRELRSRAPSSSSSASPSTTRSGSCTPQARPGCRRRSSRATAGSCSSS